MKTWVKLIICSGLMMSPIALFAGDLFDFSELLAAIREAFFAIIGVLIAAGFINALIKTFQDGKLSRIGVILLVALVAVYAYDPFVSFPRFK